MKSLSWRDINKAMCYQKAGKNLPESLILNWKRLFGDDGCTFTLLKQRKSDLHVSQRADLMLEACALGPAAEWVFGGARLCVG